MAVRLMLCVLLAGATMSNAGAQMMGAAETPSAQSSTQSPEDSPLQPDAAQQRAAKTFAEKPHAAPKPAARSASLMPLTARERVQQLLDRFTFGPRPGDVDRVLAMGEDKWLARQMAPGDLKDAALDKRLQDYPTLTMSAPQLLQVFPDGGQVSAVAAGRVPYPTDPLQNAVFEVQVYKYLAQQDRRTPDGKPLPRVELTDAQKAEAKKAAQERAAQIAGELFALPKQQRMAALIEMPVEDRIAFTGDGNLGRDQRDLLLNDFTPREREAFRAMAGQVNTTGNAVNELAQARILRDVLTERQLQAVMTGFWFNHFNVYIGKDSDLWYTTGYERDVIRKNALGNFHDLLLATAKSPAMMVYLDNWLSIGPDSLANGVNPANPDSKKGKKGLNENYGREVMELHTVGVNGGYTQTDVTALSAILTGWGVDRVNQGGGFLFDPKRHEPGPKRWMGYEIADDGTILGRDLGPLPLAHAFGPSNVAANDNSIRQGITALDILASSPKTAHFISWLLAQHFVADDPPPALVDRLTRVYLSSNGDIKTILRALIASPEFNSRQYFHDKVKTPVEFVASAFRATATDPQNPGALVSTIRQMGMPLYYALPPTGYYLTADQWMNSSALVDRLNFAYSLTTGRYANQKFDAPKLLAMGLLTPASAGDFAAIKNVSSSGAARLLGVSSTMSAASPPPGAEVALRVLEGTMIGVPVSAQTNQLIGKQLVAQPSNASATDTLNLLTALVMGSPEFQLR